MRISDLSRRSGCPVATIKFYLRERLLPPGEAKARNQAEYGERHLRRLRLIRALTILGEFELSAVREMLLAIDDEELPIPDLYAVVNQDFYVDSPESSDSDNGDARADIDEFIDRLGWTGQPDAPARAKLTRVVATLRRLGCDVDVEFFRSYAEAAEGLVLKELDMLPLDGSVDRGAAVARTILLEVALAAMRRLAHEHHVTARFSRPADASPGRLPPAV